MPICPVLTLAHKCTLQHTHTPSCNHAPFTTVRCIHTQNFYIYTVLFCYLYDCIYQHCLPLTPKAKCQKSCQDGKKLHFYFAAANWMAKVLQWFFPLFRIMLCDKRKCRLSAFPWVQYNSFTLGLSENVKRFLFKAVQISSRYSNTEIYPKSISAYLLFLWWKKYFFCQAAEYISITNWNALLML